MKLVRIELLSSLNVDFFQSIIAYERPNYSLSLSTL